MTGNRYWIALETEKETKTIPKNIVSVSIFLYWFFCFSKQKLELLVSLTIYSVHRSTLKKERERKTKIRKQIKKFLAQEVCHESDISERRSKEWKGLQLLLCLWHCCLVAVRPVTGHHTVEMNITFSYHKFHAKYFLFNNFFEKKQSKKEILEIRK